MKKTFRNPRVLMGLFVIAGISLLLGLLCISPVQGPVVTYKLALAVVAAITGMVFDYLAFPYALPSGYLVKDWRKNPDADGGDGNPDYPVIEGYILAFCATLTRRAFIIFGFIMAVALGL